MQFSAPALRRAAASLAPRGARRFAGGPPGGFFSEGTQTGRNGYLFGETPPPAGQRRQWEAWEAPWYFTFAAATVILTVGLSSKPDTSIVSWAHDEAAKRLAEKEGTA